MPVSDSQKKSAKKFQDENCKRISIIMSIQLWETLEKHLKDNNYSKNGFVIEAIKEKLFRNNEKTEIEKTKNIKTDISHDTETRAQISEKRVSENEE